VGNSDYFATAFNSVTQLLSGQLSDYLSVIAGDWLGGRVSSIDVNVAYNDIRNDLSGNFVNTGREVQLQLNLGLFNDRVKVSGGTQVGYNGVTGGANSNFVGGDVLVEFAITKNRQWNVKFYNRNEPSTIGGIRQNRLGLGLSFSRDYDSFSHMVKGITDFFQKN
jgi:hypothetical protein